MTFSEKIILDEANLKILHENRKGQTLGGFGLFKNIITKKFWTTVKTNWLTLLFVLPMIAWIFWWRMRSGSLDMTLPYSSNIGFGYPFIFGTTDISLAQRWGLALNYSLVMIPLIALACLGLAGTFNVMKYIVWGMDIKIIKTFFKGIKNSWFAFLWMGAILALCFFMMVSFSFIFDVYQVSVAVKIIMLIIGSLISLFALIMAVFVFTQGAMFSLSISQMLKNAARLVPKFIIQNIFIALIGTLLIVLVLLPIGSGGFLGTLLVMLGFILFFMLAFTWLSSAYTIYSHFIFDALYDSKRKADEKGKANDKHSDDGYSNNAMQNANPQRKKQKQVYINPKKGKKKE